MKSLAIRYGLIVVVFVLAPLLVGKLLLGPSTSSSRTSLSSSVHGHKAFSRLLESLGYKVGRFQRSAETAPEASGILIALEPGALLFRDKGRYAQGLRAWIAEGNAALITLGVDPDTAAERDDAELKTNHIVKRMKSALSKLREVDSAPKPLTKSKDQPEGEAFFESSLVGTPKKKVQSWPLSDLSTWLDVTFEEDRLVGQTNQRACPITSELVLGPKPELNLTRSRTLTKSSGRTLVSACGKTIVSEFPIGAGTVYVLSEPRFLHNIKVGRASHASLGAKLIERLALGVGSDRVYFEEFSHGRSQARTFSDLFARGNSYLVLFQLFLFIVLWVWFRMARRRAPIELTEVQNTSGKDTMQALADLYAASRNTETVKVLFKDKSLQWIKRRLGNKGSGGISQAIARKTSYSVEDIDALLALSVHGSTPSVLEFAQAWQDLRRRLDEKENKAKVAL